MKALLVCAALATCAAPAFAQQNCAPRDVVVERLEDRFGEQQQSMGLGGDMQTIVETWANTETGSWSVLVTRTDGISCLVASGEAFQITGNAPEGDPA